ncbi:hypothetical protein [Aggregatilinea lenta]|uniref:hypothetical protein n=1 Tax=Aggregatilinea lenta TaxID=913108 RepID=UPI0013C2CB18|nr:hypothetical protein [Aggregatilinea lenta]
MTEQESVTPSPEELHAVKESILMQWDRLPSDHQASMALVLVSKVADGEYRGWLLSSMALLNPQGSLPVDVSDEHLKQIGLTDEEIGQLDETNHRNIRHRIINHWLTDWFWQELEYQTRQVLEEKNTVSGGSIGER